MSCRGSSGPRRIRGWRAWLGALALAVAAGAPAHGQTPDGDAWDPLAAAYLYVVFSSGLEPVDWDGIEERLTGVPAKFAHAGTEPAAAVLERLAPFAGRDLVGPIRAAVAARDVGAFRAAMARAVSTALRERLDRVGRASDRPAAARAAAAAARALWRAFDGQLRAADPARHARLASAWQALDAALAGEGDARPAIAALGNLLRETFEAGAPPVAPPGTIRLPPDAVLAEQVPAPRRVLAFAERGIDERRLFLVAYGDMLFGSPEIFGEPARSLGVSCATCHNGGDVNRGLYVPGLSRHRGGIDIDGGLFNPPANDRRFDPLDIPSLRGIRFTAPYGRDGRTASLREFTRNVIVNEFAGAEPSPLVLDALVAFMNELDFLPAPLLYRDGRLNARASEAARRGEALFRRRFARMDGRSCADCHIPDANFLDGRRHDIGSGATASAHARDGAFDTPTLLGIAYTAPYFHDGSLPSLAAVVDWFDRRYALGLGKGEAADLAAYLEAVGTGEAPYAAAAGPEARRRAVIEAASTYLSTLAVLIPRRDAGHAALLLRTVARRLGEDTRLRGLADRVAAIRAAVEAADWPGAQRQWAAYKAAAASVRAALP